MRAEGLRSMGFRATALRYRPQVFSELIGQEHVSLTLSNAITGGRIAHAFLFSGPRGVGKTSAARILAKSLNCEQGPSPAPCGVCASCTEITESRSLDVYEIDGASNRGIEQIRDLKESVRFAPVRGRYKIYIIDEVHMLTNEAFNALLKTLEEPPESVVFIFATTEVAKVKVTIRSRCQQYSFHRISTRRIQDRLRSIALADGFSADDDALFMIARAADGSMRDAESLFDQIASYALDAHSGAGASPAAPARGITAAHVSEMLGSIGASAYFDFLTFLLEGDCAELLERIARMDNEGIDFTVFSQGLAETLRNLVLLASGASADSLELTPEDCDELRNFLDPSSADGFSLEDLMCLLGILADILAELHDARTPRRVFELALFRLIKFRDMVRPEEVLRRLESLELRLRGAARDTFAAERDTDFARSGTQNFSAPREERARRAPEETPRPPAPAPVIGLVSPAPQSQQKPENAPERHSPPPAGSVSREAVPPVAEQSAAEPGEAGRRSGPAARGGTLGTAAAPHDTLVCLDLVRELSRQVDRANPFLSRVLNEVVGAEFVNGDLRFWLLPRSKYHRGSIEASYSEQILTFFAEKTKKRFRLDCRFTDESGYDAARFEAAQSHGAAAAPLRDVPAPAAAVPPEEEEVRSEQRERPRTNSLAENLKITFGGEIISETETPGEE